MRSSGVHPDAVLAEAEAELRRVTPPGWHRRKVIPPWAGQVGGCRSCDGKTSPAVVMLTLMQPEKKVVLFTFAAMCGDCVEQPEKVRELGDRAFAKYIRSGQQ